jgi:type I restriction enzyme R subunit
VTGTHARKVYAAWLCFVHSAEHSHSSDGSKARICPPCQRIATSHAICRNAWREIQLQTSEFPRKYYLDNVQVYIAGEQAFELDPDGNVLKTVQFTDYVTENIRRLNLTAEHLREIWPQSEQRIEILNQLRSRGIDPDHLAHVTHQEEADALDLLLHVANNAPLVTRRERAEKLRQKKANFFNTFTPAAKEILNALLEKYADYGIGEFNQLPRVLQVSPFDRYGSTNEIYQLFGGAEKMLQAVDELQKFLSE